MEIYYSYTKLRKEFGRHAAFHDEAGEARARRSTRAERLRALVVCCASSVPYGALRATFLTCGSGALCTVPSRAAGQTLAHLPPDEAVAAQFVDRTPCSVSVQVGPEYSEHEARLRTLLLTVVGAHAVRAARAHLTQRAVAGEHHPNPAPHARPCAH